MRVKKRRKLRILEHYDENDIDRFNTIIRGMKEKSEATMRHSLYSIYKTTEDPIKKETARQIYLDRIGMRKDFRWQEDNKQ